MPEKRIDYARLVEQALRKVVRDTLNLVAEHGLPGRHHIYITFRTDHPGAVLADDLRARYPNEMTIVLQFEFWGLEVADDAFSVTLSFNGAPQRLTVPFAAVTVFADPSVEFGLQFTVPEKAPAPRLQPASDSPAPAPGAKQKKAQPARRSPAPVAELPKPAAKPGDGEGAEVVALDRFRKK